MLILSSEIFNDYNNLDRERKPRADTAAKKKGPEGPISVLCCVLRGNMLVNIHSYKYLVNNFLYKSSQPVSL